MYRAFNLESCDWDALILDDAKPKDETNKKIVQDALQKFVKDNAIDGTKIRDHWFPEIKANVFISHSHKDRTHALKFAGWLKRHFGLESFIDSCVWGYANDLLWQIDNLYCKNDDEKTFSYESRNGSTSHVHAILSNALGRMIRSTECAIFMNTAESISSKEAATSTKSPWLFYELGLFEIVERGKLSDYRTAELLENFSQPMKKAAAAVIPVEYPVKLESLTKLDADILNQWRKESSEREFPLDTLYRIAPE